MADHALCIFCGEEKVHPYNRCDACGKSPSGKNQLLKSLYLSEYRFSNPSEIKKWKGKLTNISNSLKNGTEFKYDESELNRMKEVEAALKNVPMSAVWKTVFKFFLPLIIGIFVLSIILVFLK